MAAGPEGRRADAAPLGAGRERRWRAGGPLLPVAQPARPVLRRPVRRAATGGRCAARRRAQLRHAAARGSRRQHGWAHRQERPLRRASPGGGGSVRPAEAVSLTASGFGALNAVGMPKCSALPLRFPSTQSDRKDRNC